MKQSALTNFIIIGLVIIPFVSSQDLERTITIVGKSFILDGAKSLRIVSGEIHYFRTPAAYWRDILTKLKLAGLNAISTYVEWSFHEAEEREYDFSGDRDVAQFIRTAAEVGLYVLLRPGPYICADRNLGGLPYWLLGKYSEIKLRSLDFDFMFETTTWFQKLFDQLSPLLYGNGGPIILVQVENEFGSYASNRIYMTALAESIRSHVGNNALLYTADRPSSVQDGFLTNSSFAAIIFGPASNITVSKALKELNKTNDDGGGPLMNAMLYTGWFSKWGQPLFRGDTAALVKTLTESLDSEVHVNLYMFFGGTNFEFTSGASVSSSPKAFTPLLTSYDYDAPLDEAGDPTPKYFAIRKVLEKYFPEVKSLSLPVAKSRGSYGKVYMKPILGLLSEEGRSMLSTNRSTYYGAQLPTFEDLRQRAGLVLYELNVTSKLLSTKYLRMIPNPYRKNVASYILNNVNTLYIRDPRDSIYVFVNGIKSGYITRVNASHHAKFEGDKHFTLSLLVENQGRIHFMNYGENNRKGILSRIMLNIGKLQGNWSVTGFNLENINVPDLKNFKTNNSASLNTTLGPVLYTGTMKLLQTPLNTYLNTKGWGKGIAWINGHNLGRYWPAVGPQLTLFVPGVWLNTAPEINVIQMLELERPSRGLTIDFVSNPVYENTK